MTEQTAEERLVEQIDKICLPGVWSLTPCLCEQCRTTAVKRRLAILDIIKQAGYKSPEEVAELLAQARDGYIKLDKEPKIKAKVRKPIHYGLPSDASQRRM